MHVLLEQEFPRTVDALLSQLTSEHYRGCTAEIHLFEDRDKRRAMRDELTARGIRARVRSAYKPLVHFFLDELDCSGAMHVRIEYPRHPLAPKNRFLLEAWPLTELFPDLDVQFEEGAEDALRSIYRVVVSWPDRSEAHKVFAPNVVQEDFSGSPVYTPSAWLTVAPAGDLPSPSPSPSAPVSGPSPSPSEPQPQPKPLVDEPVLSEYQHAYQALMKAVSGHDWGKAEPYFDRLVVSMDLPGIERVLPYGHEHISTTEAMHEEVYFSLLEFFQRHSGRPRGDRGLQPGQIVPDIRLDNRGKPRIRVGIEAPALAPPALAPPALESPALETTESVAAESGLSALDPAFASRTPPRSPWAFVDALADVDRPLPAPAVDAAVLRISGQRFTFRSRQGRAVQGVIHEGSLPAVLVTGAQHANETSGVIGALRAAQRLQRRPGANFVLIALENPDGYALHQEFCKLYPRHMHHAARYTALGDDLEYRERAPWFERQAREHAFEASGAQLHLNLHGYPAHEWTRPCTGYLPRGFELWSIPKGFFLIVRHRPGHEETATDLLEHVTGALAGNARLAGFNERQLRAYRRYVDDMPFGVLHGIPYMMASAPQQRPAVTLITEFPDETIHGDEFVFAHTVQMETVLSAAEWWWARAES